MEGLAEASTTSNNANLKSSSELQRQWWTILQKMSMCVRTQTSSEYQSLFLFTSHMALVHGYGRASNTYIWWLSFTGEN